jgi:hypothetical protein
MSTAPFRNALNDYVPLFSDKSDSTYNYYIFVNDNGTHLGIRENKATTDVLIYEYANLGNKSIDVEESGFTVEGLSPTWTTWKRLNV